MPEYPNFEDECKQEETEPMDVQLGDEKKDKEVRFYVFYFISELESSFNW